MNKHFSDNLSAKLAVAGIWVTNFCIVIATLFSLFLVTAAFGFFGFFGFLLGTFGAIISTTLWWMVSSAYLKYIQS